MSNDDKLMLIAEILRSMHNESEAQPEPMAPTFPKMRTIPQAIKEIRAEDPGTAVTAAALRRAVKRGELPCVQVESRILVNMADVYEKYLSGRSYKKESAPGTVRKVV